MTATVKVTLNTAVLDAIAASVGRDARGVVEDIANDALARSQEIVPVDTGYLKSTGKVEMAAGDEARAVISYTAPYAAYVELGTYKMGAQPYLLPGVRTAAFKMGVPATWEVMFK